MKNIIPKKKTKKETTIDDLAIMVAKGFESVDKRFDDVDKRFEDVDKRFDRLEDTVFKIDGKINGIDKRLKKVEDAIEPLMMGYSITRKEIQELNTRIFRLEKKVGVTA